jgi:small subunit ribosomal protein S4
MERQFRRYFRIALRSKGLTGAMLLAMLETRLDNVVFRLGFATSRAQARQLVQHGHIDVNGVRSNTPARVLKPGDVVSVRPRSQKLAYFKEATQELEKVTLPNWLSLDPAQMSGRLLDRPQRQDIDVSLNENLIVEYYSR